MKKVLRFCLAIVVLCSFSACGQAEKQGNAYDDVIARLEAGDYDGARLLIDIMEVSTATEHVKPTEAETESVMQTETVITATEPEKVIPSEYERIELNQYNVRDYFALGEQYFIAEVSRYFQYITLKEEYRNRLISAENVSIELTYLLTDAYGTINQKAEWFDVEYFDIVSKNKEQKTVDVDGQSRYGIFQAEYSPRHGCFQNFPMDTEIVSGSGTLILSKP